MHGDDVSRRHPTCGEVAPQRAQDAPSSEESAMPATYGRNNLAEDQVTAHSAPTRQAREPSYAKGSARTKSGRSHNQTTPLVGLPLGSPPRQALRHVLPKQTLAMDSSPGGNGDQDMNWPLNSTRWPMQGRVRRCLLARCYWWLPRSVRWPRSQARRMSRSRAESGFAE